MKSRGTTTPGLAGLAAFTLFAFASCDRRGGVTVAQTVDVAGTRVGSVSVVRTRVVRLNQPAFVGELVVTATENPAPPEACTPERQAVTGGQLTFRGTRFAVHRGGIGCDRLGRPDAYVDVFASGNVRAVQNANALAPEVAARAGWRIELHVHGSIDDAALDMTSDPPLSREDIVLLLTLGMTRAELDQAVRPGDAEVHVTAPAIPEPVPIRDDFRRRR
jgi:hypothetical protein